jgi:hypothetical protein
MGLLERPRPDGHGAVLEMAALPAERLRLRPCPEDQLHALVGSFPRFRRVEVVRQILVCGAPQQSDDQTPLGEGVEHRQLFGDSHGVALRDDRPEQRDLDLLETRGDVGGRDDRRGRQDPR